ncbi:MAG: ABC transporter ATP-binding protein [Methylophaga sp.]
MLTKQQRVHLFRLQILVLVMAFAEVAGVASIGPFMAVVGDKSHLQGEGILAQIYQFSGFNDPNDFLFWLGMVVLLTLTLAASISMFTTWKLALYSNKVGAELSSRLYKHYMNQSWLFHVDGSSSQLTNKIALECGRLTHQVITPLLQINAKLVLVAVMATAIFIINPLIALTGLTLFVSTYFLLYRTVRKRLTSSGRSVTHANQTRLKLINEGFGGIKDTLLLGRQKSFVEQFDEASRHFAKAQGTIQGLAQVPRYAMELVAFGAIVVLILYLLATYQGNLGTILPLLSIYALAGFKLLPAFQQIYAGVSTLRSHISAFENLQNDLVSSQHPDAGSEYTKQGTLKLNKEITMQDVVFRYPSKTEPALNHLEMTFAVNQVTGLVGASGSGKSTAIDMLLGLIEPDKGKLMIDGKPLTGSNKRQWQNTIGYVPQSIFLADASIRENIAFGLSPDEIDDGRVTLAANMAHLEELLNSLPDGLNTRVGERGVQLSGGQRQRIGIARALYDDPDVLVLDEATSALDGITEKLVMDAIHDFSGKKTIIMIAHRLATVKQCDQIYLMDKGKVIDSGTFDQLIDNNAMFKHMAHHA